MKFKVGDRVRAIRECDGRNLIGYEGTVKVIDSGIYVRLPIGVEFDKKFDFGHDLDGSVRNGHGRWCEESSLELIKDETIVIYRKGNEVIALDKSTGKKAVAKCSPADKFDFNVGAKLAFERLTKNVTFRLLCINETIISEKGKIYEFVDSVTTWKDGTHSKKYDDINEFKRKNCITYEHFVELKDGDDPAEILKKYEPIKVGDVVKVIDTGKAYTTCTDYFKENEVPRDTVCRYAYGDSLGYDRGIRKLSNDFKVVFVAHNRCIIEASSGKCYLIGCDGVEKC